MATNPQRPSVDGVIANLAARQHGNVTHLQLAGLGLSKQAISHRQGQGRLHRAFFGVYAVGRPATTALERSAAAVLACGEGAALSHFAAMALWGLGRWRRRIDVTVVRDRRPSGIVVHVSRTLHWRDVRTHQGIRATTHARTLLDCAPLISGRALTRAVNDALRAKQLRRRQLTEIVHRCPLHRGAKLLRPFADERTGPTRSGLEDDFKAFCKRFAIPVPQTNVRVGGYEVDAYFPEAKLIVELDSWQYHSDKDTFQRDRNRDADELAHGLATVRITPDRLDHDPESEADRLLKILERRRSF